MEICVNGSQMVFSVNGNIFFLLLACLIVFSITACSIFFSVIGLPDGIFRKLFIEAFSITGLPFCQYFQLLNLLHNLL